jgi:hypothetical protein
MTNHFKIACGAVAAMTLVMVVFVGRSSSPEPEVVVASDAPTPPTPAEGPTAEELAIKARQELAAAMNSRIEGPRLITTETIKFEDRVLTPPPPGVIPGMTPTPKVVKLAETNLCTRHNMHKVWVSKYKWRCKK